MPTKKAPKPSAASSASPTPAVLRHAASDCSSDASTMPTSASPSPALCSAPICSPLARPTTSGTSAAVAEIGATTLIAPTARPR